MLRVAATMRFNSRDCIAQDVDDESVRLGGGGLMSLKLLSGFV